jgi:predicted dehydrogenase
LVGVADSNAAQAEAISVRCSTKAFTDYRSLFDCVDAVVVAAPTAHHYAISSDFVRRGKHVLVEKPLTAEPAQANELVNLAKLHDVVLQVGHIERFNPAYEELRHRPLRPKYISCERYGGFSARSTDIGAVFDLMVHDLDLVLAMVRAPVESVWAVGAALLGGHEDMAKARVTFADGCVADFAVSRVHPAAARRMYLWGAEGFAAIDFARRHLTLMQPSEILRQGRIDSRRLDPATAASLKGELFSQYIHTCELDCPGGDQLTAELRDFISAIRESKQPRVDGAAGRDTVALAARILDALGRPVRQGNANEILGPHQMPSMTGELFISGSRQAAA